MIFTKAIVRKPGASMVNGLTTVDLGLPDYALALDQHIRYVEALKACKVEVIELDPLEEYPDSCFVEDVALCLPGAVVLTIPGDESRKGEVERIAPALKPFFNTIEIIEPPATIEAGDILMVEEHFYIGLSDRTNPEGARQMTAILESHGLTASTVDLAQMLHLKTGVAYLGDETVLVAGEFISNKAFTNFKSIEVPAGESYAANCIRVNDYVIVPEGYPKTRLAIEKAGFKVLTVDVSEFRKLDGGLSCLSLRF